MSQQLRARPVAAPNHSSTGGGPAPSPGLAGGGNSFRLAQLQESGAVTRSPRPQARPADLTPENVFGRRFDAQRDREIDPSEPRWRRLSMEEAALLEATEEDERVDPGELGYAAEIGDDTWQWDAHEVNPEQRLTAGDLMGDGDQAFSRAFQTANPEHEDRTDVTVLNADGTRSVLPANEHGMVELPESGHGFSTHNRDDVRVNGSPQPDQWGDAASVERVMNTMSDYATMFPGSSLSIGDLSTDTGNSPRLRTGRTARHATHYDGTQVDLRYPDGTGSSNRSSTRDGDLFRTRSFLRIAESHGMDNVHAARNLRGDLFHGEGTDVHFSRPHDNHLHIGQGKGRR